MEMEEPEYEQFAAFGPNIGNVDVASAIMLSWEVDNLGMEVNEAGWVIGFIMECYEKGILTKEDVNGLEMTWENVQATQLMLKMIARREGFGNVLAEGVMRAAEHIGGEAVNLAVYTKKGNSPRGHDHRTRWWEMFDTCVSNTGTFENNLGGYALDMRPDRYWKDVSTAMAKTKGSMQIEDSMVTCRFNTRQNVDLLSQAVSAVTGWDFTWEEAMKAGLRIVNLMRAFNVRHGLTWDLDYPSLRYGSMPADGPYRGENIMLYWDKMLHNYYKEMGWDEETGKPLPETLKNLELEYVIRDLW
jgi:aldehyde:ferredoxin oxidoreductase